MASLNSSTNREMYWFHISQFLDFKSITESITIVSKAWRQMTLKKKIWLARAQNICSRNERGSILTTNKAPLKDILKLEERMGCRLRVDVREGLKISSGDLCISKWHDASQLIAFYQHLAPKSLPLNLCDRYIRIGEMEKTELKLAKRTIAMADVLLSTSTWLVFAVCEVNGEGVVSQIGTFEDWLETLTETIHETQQRQPTRPLRNFSTNARTVLSNTIRALKIAYTALRNVSIEEVYFGIEGDEETNVPEILVA